MFNMILFFGFASVILRFQANMRRVHSRLDDVARLADQVYAEKKG